MMLTILMMLMVVLNYVDNYDHDLDDPVWMMSVVMRCVDSGDDGADAMTTMVVMILVGSDDDNTDGW